MVYILFSVVRGNFLLNTHLSRLIDNNNVWLYFEMVWAQNDVHMGNEQEQKTEKEMQLLYMYI